MRGRSVWRHLAAAVLAVAGVAAVQAQDLQTRAPLGAVAEQLGLLADPAQPWDALVIELAGGDFLQVTADAGPVILDFPLMSARQQALESRARALLGAAGVAMEEVGLADGRVLVARLGAVPEAAGHLQRLAADLYGAGPQQAVLFLLIDFGP